MSIGGAYLDKGMEEAQSKQQLLEGSGLLTIVEKGWVADWVIQVALQQIGSQALQHPTPPPSQETSQEDPVGFVLDTCIVACKGSAYRLLLLACKAIV